MDTTGIDIVLYILTGALALSIIALFTVIGYQVVQVIKNK